MSVRNFRQLFNPSSVALIGASTRPNSVGAVAMRNIYAAGFQGDIFLVNSKHTAIEGHPCFADIASLPKAPDLVVIATAPDSVPALIAELGARGTKAAVVITAGFGEGENIRGQELCDAMLEAARPYLLRIVGPNCFGLMLPRVDLNASFIHIQPLPGRLAFVAQSGALLSAVVDWATHRRIGFSHLVSLGDMADVDFGDMLDYLAADGHTRAILLYVEAITHARKFMSAARAAARVKPVIVVKAGRYGESALAASSHTGAMAGSDAVYEAAFRRAGILRVNDLEALFDAVTTLGMLQPLTGDRLAILTNGGGMGVMATDTLIYKQGNLARLEAATMDRLNAALPSTWSHGNPVDIIGDASPERYIEALNAIMDDPGVDAVLVMNCPTGIASSTEPARAVLETIRQRLSTHARPCGVLTSWIGEGPAEAARCMFREQGIPSYETPTKAVRGFMQMVRYKHSQAMLMEVPADVPQAFSPDREAARRILETVLAEQRDWLLETEAKAVLTAYGIPTVPTLTAESPEAAARMASEIDGPVVLKILSKTVLHKSDAGGVALNLETPDAVLERATWMLKHFERSSTADELPKFSVQSMIQRPHAHELIVGMSVDAQFGPVLLFGHGGTATEVILDRSLALPPLNMNLAQEMIAGTRIYRLLAGYRGVPPADLAGIAVTLVKVSQLVCDFSEIAELDINPLLCDPRGVLALDARLRIQPTEGPADRRLAICPYPTELEQVVRLPDGQSLRLRPIRPEDEPAFQRFFVSLSPEDIRLRFLHPMKLLPKTLAARLTQIDYDREMALVLTGEDPQQTDLFGIVRISADPDNEKAEFAILLHREMTGAGLGPMLMRRIIDYARSRGISEIFGEVLDENRSMLALCKAMGFKRRNDPEDPGVVRVSLQL